MTKRELKPEEGFHVPPESQATGPLLSPSAAGERLRVVRKADGPLTVYRRVTKERKRKPAEESKQTVWQEFCASRAGLYADGEYPGRLPVRIYSTAPADFSRPNMGADDFFSVQRLVLDWIRRYKAGDLSTIDEFKSAFPRHEALVPGLFDGTVPFTVKGKEPSESIVIHVNEDSDK